jgi:peptidyl-prolyl cis-trans isomerase B (cyclophilin B)
LGRKFKFSRVLALLAVSTMIGVLLSACGDSTATPVSAATINPFNAPITPVPTPVASATADTIPNLVYSSNSKEIKVSDTFSKQVITNLGSAASLVGKFNGDKISIYSSSDAKDKIEEYYRKLMISSNWGAFNRQGDDVSTILVYQKAGTKLIINISQLGSLDNFPQEMKSQLKQNDSLILVATGVPTDPPPTPLVIPGTPIATVGANQKKIFTIELDKGGTIIGELYPDLAPISVENFEKLSSSGFYNGLTFHRVEPNFVVQGGDPKGDGTGGPGYTIPGEFETNTGVYTLPATLKDKAKHVYGSLAMARSTDLNSAGSQFYIVTGQETDASVASLNGKYAVFGKVTQGMDLVVKIQKGDKIKSIKIEVK